ncbi:MAG: hypothetical protein QXH91_01170, partial [Candidatus Bathyarchaeia archaeon]
MKEISDEIQNRFAEMTCTGSCTVVSQEFAPHELIIGPDIPSFSHSQLPQGVTIIRGETKQGIPFGKLFQLLADRLREAKE